MSRAAMMLPGVVLVLVFAVPGARAGEKADDAAWKKIAPFFQPPAEYAKDFGGYRSPLVFDDGTAVRTPADWARRRQEILKAWHGLLGAWPPLLEKPAIETLAQEHRETFTQKKVRLPIATGCLWEGYLLVPDAKGPIPAVLVVYYDPENGAGLGKQPLRDFGYQLTKRGFVTLSIGWPRALCDENRQRVQPLSMLAYVAANCHRALAGLTEVDAGRIGVVGHSFGGKWAMFAACLYERFACGAWSDPGVAFDEKRGNVNYWDPWYLGFEPGRERKTGLPTKENPAIGAYRTLREQGRDLHELQALMAPRPFLVSGGAEDGPQRWRALNHPLAVNRLLGLTDRVAMTNRSGHSPTTESNEQLYTFFEHFLGNNTAAAPTPGEAEK